MRILMITAAVFAATPATAVELVANGGFETGDFSGWTRFGALGRTLVNTASARTGSFGAQFAPAQPGGIFQDLVTVAGEVYTVKVALAHTAGGTATPLNSFRFDFDGVNLASFGSFGAFPYTVLSYSHTASSALTRIQLTLQDARSTVFYLDDVSAVGPVPEPATWGMMVAGFGFAGAAMRRRARNLRVVAA